MDYSSGAAWMDGKSIPISEAKFSVFDWGLTRSDITYDVVHVWQGAFFRLDDYLDRFHSSMIKLLLDVWLDRSAICSALIDPRGVVTSQLPSARWVVTVTGVWVKYCAPWTRADFAKAYVAPDGSRSPSCSSQRAAR